MNCPHCRVPLAIADRQGVEVDYCPQCRGVWLDRGELDKIIERTLRQFDAAPQPHLAPQPQPAPMPPPQAASWGHGDHHGHYHKPPYGPHKHHKRKSFLEEIFDF